MKGIDNKQITDAHLKVKEAESRIAAGANANNVAISAPNNVDAKKITSITHVQTALKGNSSAATLADQTIAVAR